MDSKCGIGVSNIVGPSKVFKSNEALVKDAERVQVPKPSNGENLSSVSVGSGVSDNCVRNSDGTDVKNNNGKGTHTDCKWFKKERDDVSQIKWYDW